MLVGALILGGLTGCVPGTPTPEVSAEPTAGAGSSSASPVAEPTEEDVIRVFFALIDEDRAADAVLAMSARVTGDDTAKQAWAVQFAAMTSVNVTSIEPSMPAEWTADRHGYKVVLDTVMDPASADAPIPFYGYADSTNTRWVTIVREGGLWKIDGIGTGP
jgi:hypothetical protein